LLILDEATSALDTEAEQQVQIALEELMKNRTSFVIAHRLSTIQKADLILVLKQGSIVASGTHKSLLKNSEEYKSWVQMQRMD
jgi:subfamily B ATP-binding cassette protein MsbA